MRTLRPLVVKPPRHCNADVVLTFVAEPLTVPTRDMFDRAHQVRDCLGHGLEPNARVVGGGARGRGGKVVPLRGSRARQYHPSQLACVERDAGGRPVSGVAFDSSFDELRRVQEELDGIPGIGLNSGGGSCTGSTSGAVTRALAELASRYGSRGAREITRCRF